MKLKTITLIAAIMFAITTIYSIYGIVLFYDKSYADAMFFINQGIYVFRDIAICLFFFILYKNQK